MITIKLITNSDLIKSYCMKDDMHKIACIDEITYNDKPDTINYKWVEVSKDNTVIGIVVLREVFADVISFHGGMFKPYRNRYTPQALKEVLEQLRNQLDCQFMTSFSEKRTDVAKLVKYCGLKFKMKIKHPKDGIHVVYAEDIE